MDAGKLLESERVPLGRKPDPAKTGRLAEARRLTKLMSAGGGFSYVRLGDKDVAFLLYPEEVVTTYGNASSQISGTQAHGSPGLKTEQTFRLRRALENASYVDFWECQWKDANWLDRLNLDRSASSHRNPSRETSYILGTWLECEFKNYCENRRVLFCGAEAPLLQALQRRESFLKHAGNFWPSKCKSFFLRPRDNGKNVGENIDSIKNDIRESVLRNDIDTVFVSLGGAAKIICQELAEEMGICAFDFGVGMRSLTYSGSGGYMAARSTHLVFLFRLPFNLYMDALEDAFPDLTAEELLAKAHAQLMLEVQEKEVGWSHTAWENDFSRPNIINFGDSYKEYQKRFKKLINKSKITRREKSDFLHFCGTHNLTLEGQLFIVKFRTKAFISRLIGRTR